MVLAVAGTTAKDIVSGTRIFGLDKYLRNPRRNSTSDKIVECFGTNHNRVFQSLRVKNLLNAPFQKTT